MKPERENTTRDAPSRDPGGSDPAAADRDDPFAAVGADESRPPGDTTEAHDEISPHDLPAGHPARAAEHLVDEDDGHGARVNLRRG